MATGSQRRTRAERVAALGLAPGQWERAWSSLRRRDVLGRMGMALLAALAATLVIRGWDPPFAYRPGYTPPRRIVASVEFSRADQQKTDLARERAKSQVRYTYSQDPEPLVQLRASLRNSVVELTSASSLKEVDPKLWADFALPRPDGAPKPSQQEQEEQFTAFRETFAGKENVERFEKALAAAFAPFEQRGLLDRLPQQFDAGNQEEILVHPAGHPEPMQILKVSEVLIGDGAAIKESLRKHLGSDEVTNRIFAWLRPRLGSMATLELDEAATKMDLDEAAAKVPTVEEKFDVGRTLAEAGKPLDLDSIRLLRLEYENVLAERARNPLARLSRGTAVTLLIFGLFVLCGVYMRYRQRGPLVGLRPLVVMLVLAVACVALARWASAGPRWHAELVPPMIFGMTVAIVYSRELAVLSSGVLAMILVVAIGQGLPELLLLLGVTTAASLSMGRIRSRAKLIYVGILAGMVAATLLIVAGIINDQPLSLDMLRNAAYAGLWALAAGFLMTGLLPFIEHLFGILTDLSLLELGDVAHPLLQELVRRAPSTYNHSITVGTISEAAAESIGGRGLLCRVGAYFHDIGKMLKPGYFIENQGTDGSRHEGLVPAMSTLVIIAHIKDGADLARQYRLPQPIVDLIAQHHGTTLVEYFFDRANEQQQASPNGGSVDESRFRYPGPKPQTKEAAVLMLADAVESASRTLVEPTPARIESLVGDIAHRRLHDGQFDESGLTLRELRTIERSMVMSLTAIYHGRIKYPEQKTA